MEGWYQGEFDYGRCEEDEEKMEVVVAVHGDCPPQTQADHI